MKKKLIENMSETRKFRGITAKLTLRKKK